MSDSFRKRNQDGVVINTGGDFENYLRAKESAKALAKTKRSVIKQEYEIQDVKSELRDIKKMLQLLLDKEK